MSPHEAAAMAVACAACVFDLRSRRIPNALTFGAALAAFAVAAVAGPDALVSSAAGWTIGLAMWLPIYMLGGMGAGDVKLIAAIGAWLGPLGVIHAALAAAVAGGVIALAIAITNGCLARTIANVQLLILHWRVAGFSPQPQLTLESATGPRLAYAVPTLLGTAAAIWLR